MSSVILPPPTEQARSEGMSLWLPTRDAKRLAVLAKDYGESYADTLSRVIAFFFKSRQNGA